MKRIMFFLLLIAFVSTMGCGGGRNQRPSRDRNVIELDEIQRYVRNAESVWRLIEMARPRMLTRDRRRINSLSGTGGMDALVYLNGSRMGNKFILYELSPLNVERIEYIDGFSAPSRYGPDSAGGVFLLTMR